jgi:hypothetical protein
MTMTTKKRIGIAIFAPFGIALFIFIGGEIVLHLWNWLAPRSSAGGKLPSGRRSDCWLSVAFCSEAGAAAVVAPKAGVE